MTLAEGVLVMMWVGVTLYALLGGADFGGGFWDLVAGGAKRGAAQRAVIEEAMGPVWEANHVWLIFVLVVLWTGFPTAFASVASTLFIPLTAAAVGIILRGSAFAFRKAAETVELRRAFGATFALSSVVTPFFLGTVAGAVASGRIPAEGTGDVVGSWINPTSILGGALAVAVCAYLAAVFLTADARRAGRREEAEGFRRRGIAAATATGATALAGIAVLSADAPTLFDGLTDDALPLVVVSGIGGLGSMGLLWSRRYAAARVAAALAVVAVMWGWAVAQYPFLLTDTLSIAAGAGDPTTLRAVLWSLGVGSVLFGPPLVWLLVLTQRDRLGSGDAEESHSKTSRRSSAA